jgi:uncharacterized protein YbcI
VADPVYFQVEKDGASFQYHLHDNKLNESKLTNKQRRQLQHEFKIHLEKYWINLIGKGSDFTKVTIWNDMLILRCEGFLTDPEKYVAAAPKGSKLVKESRMHIAKQFAVDNVPYFEAKLGANCIHQTFDVESNKDFWIHVIIFDQLLIEIK